MLTIYAGARLLIGFLMEIGVVCLRLRTSIALVLSSNYIWLLARTQAASGAWWAILIVGLPIVLL